MGKHMKTIEHDETKTIKSDVFFAKLKANSIPWSYEHLRLPMDFLAVGGSQNFETKPDEEDAPESTAKNMYYCRYYR